MTAPEAVESPAGIGGADSESLRRALALIRVWRDPALPGLVFHSLLAVAGFVLLVVGVIAMTGTPYVPLQLPFVISGGLGGAALLGVGAVLTAVLAERRDRVEAMAEMQDVVDEVRQITSIAAQRR